MTKKQVQALLAEQYAAQDAAAPAVEIVGAAEMASRINAHRAKGGKVWSHSYAGTAGIGDAFVGACGGLFVGIGRSRKPVCLLPQVARDGRRTYAEAVSFR